MLSIKDISVKIEKPAFDSIDEANGFLFYIERYPYAQIFPILYLKALKELGDARFDEELAKYAFNISDREFLYTLIHTSFQQEKENDDHKITNIESEKKGKEDITETENPNATGNKEKIKIPTDPLEKTILANIVNSAYELENLSSEEEQKLIKEQQEKEAERKDENKNNKEKEPLPSSLPFTVWLNAGKNLEEIQQQNKKLEELSSSKKNLEEIKTQLEKLKKGKKKFFSPTEKAKESLKEEELPVSETLAKIYEIQGNFVKAIEAYSKLSLKYPKKKVFFANRIKELRKKINK